MQAPGLHGKGDHEAAQEEHDRAVEVDRRGVVPGHDPQKGIEDERHQRGGEQRNGVGDPPDRHEKGHRGQAAGGRVARVYREGEEEKEGAEAQQ